MSARSRMAYTWRASHGDAQELHNLVSWRAASGAMSMCSIGGEDRGSTRLLSWTFSARSEPVSAHLHRPVEVLLAQHLQQFRLQYV